MANPLPLATFLIGTALMGVAPIIDGQYVVSEFAAIVASTAIVAAATKFFRMDKAIKSLDSKVTDLHARLDKLDVPQSDSTTSHA